MSIDIDFGRIRGWVIPLGKLFGRIKIPALPLSPNREFTILLRLFLSFPLWLLNCGRHPFSEPETQAMRNLTRELSNNDFSFYVNCHTATHYICIPWKAFKPPFEKSKQEQYIFDYVEELRVARWERKKEDISIGYNAALFWIPPTSSNGKDLAVPPGSPLQSYLIGLLNYAWISHPKETYLVFKQQIKFLEDNNVTVKVSPS